MFRDHLLVATVHHGETQSNDGGVTSHHKYAREKAKNEKSSSRKNNNNKQPKRNQSEQLFAVNGVVLCRPLNQTSIISQVRGIVSTRQQ
jgi:hypothetical protein